MKKTIVILSVILALVACNKEVQVVEEPNQIGNLDFKVNLTITRNDANNDTKGTVKTTAWVNGDVVFIFFNGIEAPKYLEMKYNNGWVFTGKGNPENELKASDFSGKESGTMTAIYLPYGSDFSVTASGDSFVFSETYSGYYYQDQKKAYSFSGNTLSTTEGNPIALTPVSPETGNVRVHFDISGGFNSGHSYLLTQDYVKAINLNSISADGTVNKTVSTYAGVEIPGYYDADPNNDGETNDAIFSFSGELNADAVNTPPTKYRFVIHDKTEGDAYSREIVPPAAITGNTHIGIGNISFTEGEKAWKHIPYPYFSAGPTKLISIARSNLAYLGATGGEHPWQLLEHPWSIIEYGDGTTFVPSAETDFALFGWGTSGYKDCYPWKHDWTDAHVYEYGPADGVWADDWDWAKHNTVYEYGGVTPLSGNYYTPSVTDNRYLVPSKLVGPHSVEDSDLPRYRKNGRAVINNGTRMVKGVIFIPDTWKDPRKTTFKGTANSAFNNGDNLLNGGWASTWGTESEEATTATNYYTASDWSHMESAGAVFLPVTGFNGQGTLWRTNTECMYWSGSDTPGVNGSGFLNVSKDAMVYNGSRKRFFGLAVRLIRDLN